MNKQGDTSGEPSETKTRFICFFKKIQETNRWVSNKICVSEIVVLNIVNTIHCLLHKY